jgi:hypothetical protein
MPIDRILLAVVLAISIVLLVLLAPAVRQTWQTYTGTRVRRQEDFTDQAPLPEPEEAERIDMLNALGYRRLGETVTRMPIGEEVARILVAADGRAYAMVLAGFDSVPGLTGFFSAWPDGTWVGTLHPRGDALEIAGLRLRVETGTLADAEASHRAAATHLVAEHGEPRRVRELADMLALDADYRTRFGGRELRSIVARSLAPAAFVLVVLVVALALLVAAR